MLGSSVVFAGAVNTFIDWAVNDDGLLRVATTLPGLLELLFSLIVTAVVAPEAMLPNLIDTWETVYPAALDRME